MSRSFFNRAENFCIENLYVGGVHHHHSQDPLKVLAKNAVAAATHDSEERSNAPRCYPATRIAVQIDATKWIHRDGGPDGRQNLLWITGPAGAGKSAIAGSLAESCKDDGSLAASFFFSSVFGLPYCRSTKRLISTLVYQLIQHKELVELRKEILSVISCNPLIFEKCLREQLKHLLLDPLRKIGYNPSTIRPKVILIDGFDECDSREPENPTSTKTNQKDKEAVHKEALSALLDAAKDPIFPFRIIIVSRPDYIIKDFFSRNSASTTTIFLDEGYKPDADITHFVKSKFAEIRQRFKLPDAWPECPDEVVRAIVNNSSGQFIYAATVMRYITDRDSSPTTNLHRILQWDALKCDSTHSPFKHLDALYLGILQTSPDPLLAVRLIHAILELHSESGDSMTAVKAFLESEHGEMEHLLGNLSALLDITESFRFFHKSLLDYLGSPQRCGDLYVDAKSTMVFLQSRWYNLLKNRGPQTALADSDRALFLRRYTGSFTTRYFRLSPQGQYLEPAYVEWWLEIAYVELVQHRETRIESLRDIVHETCRWFNCHPDCKTWRKALHGARSRF